MKPLRYAIALSLLSSSASVYASASTADTGTLADIVVTAQKHEESAQKTAISMNVYSAEKLVEEGIHDIPSLVTNDPSINLTMSNGAGYLAVRGIASTDLTEIGDPSVSISRDGFFSNRSYGLFSSLYDVARIEVLKGPQGTLFGRNSTGGAVNIVTNRPGKEFDAAASLELGNYNAHNFEGMVNLPFSDSVQFRASGVSRQHDGYRDNGPNLPRGDDEDDQSGRLQLAFQPSEHFDGLVSVQQDTVGGVGDVSLQAPFATVLSNYDASSFPLQTKTSVSMRDTRLRWEFHWTGLPGGTQLTYLGGHDKTEWHHSLDASSATGLGQFIQEENPVTVNHELRLTSAPGERLFWQAGLFYFKETNDPLHSGLQQQSGPFAGDYLIHFDYAIETVSKAAFGQFSYQFTDDLKFSAGARYTNDQKTRTGNALLDLTVASGGFLWFDTTNPGPPVPVFTCAPGACIHYPITTPGNGHTDESKPTYHVGLDYQVTPENLLYIKYDTGFKSGGFNSNGSAPSVPYGPENVTATELGSKNRFLGNTVELNAALFHQQYGGYQASQFTAALGGGPGVQNAGSARINGLEAELVVAPKGAGRFDLSATWLDAKFTDFNAVNAAGNATVDLSGNELPNAPKFTATAGYEHDFAVLGGSLKARVDGKYTSSFNYSFFNFVDTEAWAATVGNALLSYTPDASHWNTSVFVRNFTNKVYLTHAQENTNVNLNNYEFGAPRTYGIRFQYRWK
jgi:iron complex outermembrane recepter protein